MDKIISLNSVADVHAMLGLEAPAHPLISIVKNRPQTAVAYEGIRIVSNLYIIALKLGMKCVLQYGRNLYDYDEGTLVFIAPGQVLIPSKVDEPDLHGWSLIFHPDFLHKTNLGSTIVKYAFFDYDICEALHVSEQERLILAGFASNIEKELQIDVDKYSLEIIAHNLESILKYSQRFYERQFLSRLNSDNGYHVRLKKYLIEYFNDNLQVRYGIPTLDDCGKALNMSGKYLSDLLKKETEKSLTEHIHSFLINEAKTILLNSNQTVEQIAYSLGYKYPQHFSKFFKTKTGFSPSEFRKII
ncbi:MAG: helix-turn-helix transcriptional regulator [Flavobacteriaceae bacterium]|nr:helix-turn-helix transcriptional regulator [Flavobacteriaceae bacterium]